MFVMFKAFYSVTLIAPIMSSIFPYFTILQAFTGFVLYFSVGYIHLVYECAASLTAAGNSTLLASVFTAD